MFRKREARDRELLNDIDGIIRSYSWFSTQEGTHIPAYGFFRLRRPKLEITYTPQAERCAELWVERGELILLTTHRSYGEHSFENTLVQKLQVLVAEHKIRKVTVRFNPETEDRFGGTFPHQGDKSTPRRLE